MLLIFLSPAERRALLQLAEEARLIRIELSGIRAANERIAEAFHQTPPRVPTSVIWHHSPPVQED